MYPYEISRTKEEQDIFTLEKVKNYIRAVEDVDDDLIEDLIEDSIDMVEMYLQSAIVEQEISAYYDCAIDKAYLPFSPITSEELTVLDENGDSVSFDVFGGKKKRITVSVNRPFKVVYDAGMGVAVPNAIRNGILSLVMYLYEHRGEQMSEIPKDIKMKLDPYRNVWI
jgi:hypothetical protein